jgi:hypothetical protein
VSSASAVAARIPVGSSAKNIWRAVGHGGVLLVRNEQNTIYSRAIICKLVALSDLYSVSALLEVL